MLPAATNGLALGSGLGTHCNRKRRLNAAVLRARLLLSPHSSQHLLLHAAPLMWLNDRTVVVLQDRSPRARCQDPTRREDTAGRRREQRGTATAATSHYPKVLESS